jgi:hypothetical protein
MNDLQERSTDGIGSIGCTGLPGTKKLAELRIVQAEWMR